MKVTAKNQQLSFHVDNLTTADALFFARVIALLCDPENEAAAREFRAGRSTLHFAIVDHAEIAQPLFSVN